MIMTFLNPELLTPQGDSKLNRPAVTVYCSYCRTDKSHSKYVCSFKINHRWL